MPVHDPAGALGTDTPAGDYVRLPLRINPSGILAPLAASVFAPSLWAIILYAGGRDTHPLMALARNGVGYGIVDGLLIALLAVCCGLASADSAQIAGVLKDAGGWIPGCRPGEDTARALRRTQVVLAFFCMIYLPAACVLPYVIAKQFQLPLALSGFSFFLLIWVMLRVLEQARFVLRS
jgi:preprotein translocase subunit SecY